MSSDNVVNKPDDELHFVFAFDIQHFSLIFPIKISASLSCILTASENGTRTF